MINLSDDAVRTIGTGLWQYGVDETTIHKFIAWLDENFAIWRAFESYALQAIASGKKVGAKAICERIRWFVEIESGGDYKVNNNYTAYLARIFMLKHKNEYFETRIIKGLAA